METAVGDVSFASPLYMVTLFFFIRYSVPFSF